MTANSATELNVCAQSPTSYHQWAERFVRTAPRGYQTTCRHCAKALGKPKSIMRTIAAKWHRP